MLPPVELQYGLPLSQSNYRPPFEASFGEKAGTPSEIPSPCADGNGRNGHLTAFPLRSGADGIPKSPADGRNHTREVISSRKVQLMGIYLHPLALTICVRCCFKIAGLIQKLVRRTPWPVRGCPLRQLWFYIRCPNP